MAITSRLVRAAGSGSAPWEKGKLIKRYVTRGNFPGNGSRTVTTPLWSWRDEDGPAAECFAELGRAALRAGPGGLWPWLTGRPGA